MANLEYSAWSEDEKTDVLRAVVETTPECIKIVAGDGTLLQMNAAGLQMLECNGDADVRGGSIARIIAPEHWASWKEQHRRVCNGERLSWEFDIVGLRGTRRHLETHAVPLRLPDGTMAQLAITRDITRRKKAEREQKLLIDELNHRVKNMLASVQSLIALTARGTSSVTEYRKALEARILAMSVAHDRLSKRNWIGAGVDDLVKGCLAPYLERGDVKVSGPPAKLYPRAAIILSMVLHELATNAAKYGALSVPGGEVNLRWSIAGSGEQQSLAVNWTEQGGPAVAPPAARGFGSELIERGFAAELGGKASLRFEPAGLRCDLEMPLSVAARDKA